MIHVASYYIAVEYNYSSRNSVPFYINISLGQIFKLCVIIDVLDKCIHVPCGGCVSVSLCREGVVCRGGYRRYSVGVATYLAVCNGGDIIKTVGTEM